MRFVKAVLAVLIVALCANAYNNAVVSGNVGSTYPINTSILTLYDTDITDAQDSIGVDSFVVMGPYKLTGASGQPQYTALQAFYPNDFFTGGDSVEVSYQIVPGVTLADTGAVWTAIDTVTDSGEQGAYTSLASLIGASIAFKLKALGDTQLIIKKAFKVVFKDGFTYSKQH